MNHHPIGEDREAREALGQIHNLPTLPSVVLQVVATAADPDASALDLARHIIPDQSLSATLLRMANSAYYGFYRRISSATDAIVVLGFSKVRDIALTATAFQTLKHAPGAFDLTQLWRHSLAAAMAAEQIARVLHLPPINGYFSAGLLHDIGKVALGLLYPAAYEQAVQLVVKEGIPVCQAERSVLKLDHCAAGAALGEHWNLPLPVVEAIRRHHEPERSVAHAELVHVTALANVLAYESGMGDRADVEILMPDMQLSLELLGLRPEQREHVIQRVRESSGRIDDLLGVLNTD